MKNNSSNLKISDIYGLTPLQEGMLYHNLTDDKSEEYVIQFGFQMKGSISQSDIEEALGYLTQKHEVLKTSIMHMGLERPLQVEIGRAHV